MATYDLTVSNAVMPAHAARTWTVTKTFTAATEAAKLGISDFAASDVIKLIDIPANTWVRNVVIQVATAVGGTCTGGTGDTGSATQFLTATNLNSKATTAAAASTNKFYATADSINLVPSAAPAALVLNVSATFEGTGL